MLFTLACPPVWLDKGIWLSLKWAKKTKKVGREGFPGGSVVKTPPQCRDVGLTSGSGRSLGWWDGHPLQRSCLEDPMDRGAWWATVHRVAKSWTWLKWLSMHAKWTENRTKDTLCKLSSDKYRICMHICNEQHRAYDNAVCRVLRDNVIIYILDSQSRCH